MAVRYNRASALVLEALFPILVLIFSATALHATRVRLVNLEELTQRADRIFSGRVADVRDIEDPKLGRRVTLVTVDVDRAVKGRVDRTITFKQIAGPDPRTGVRSGIVGMPLYSKGEEVILFLAGESASGLTSPLGLGQGKFVILEDKKGQRRALNGAANKMLFSNLSLDAGRRLGPEGGQTWGSPEGGQTLDCRAGSSKKSLPRA